MIHPICESFDCTFYLIYSIFHSIISVCSFLSISDFVEFYFHHLHLLPYFIYLFAHVLLGYIYIFLELFEHVDNR